MEKEELLYALALQRTKGIGDIYAKKMIEICGSPKNIFKEKQQTLQKLPGFGRMALQNLFDSSTLAAAEKEVELLEKENLQTLYFLDKNYPNQLKNCADSPILLFQDGNFSFENSKCISIVGTRQMTRYGSDFCESLISGLKEYNPIIVSGYALGIDIIAHKSALKNNLKTVAVFAHGFGSVYPKQHKRYQSQLLKKGGFLTEFWYDEKPRRENFVRRNRIVAGLSEATIVVESASKGGALITAALANSYSKEVFAVPGRASDRYSSGCNALIRDHKAAVITCADDLINMLGWAPQKKTSTAMQTQLFLNLNAEQQKVYDCLKSKKIGWLDNISLDCNLPINKMAALLFQLEMKGLVQPLPGKMFQFVYG